MPQMGYDMHEGTLVRWLKSEDSEVSLGEPIAEIETDKAVVEVESTSAGLLRRILVSEGTTVPVGQPIAIIGEAGEEIDDVSSAEPVSEAAAEELEAIEEPAEEHASIPLPASTTEPIDPAVPEAEQEVRASPVARRLAAERGVDLALITGTGPGGRITRDDVLGYEAPEPTEEPAAVAEAAGEPATEPLEEEPQEPEAAPEPTPAPAPVEGAPAETVPLSRMRQQIARVTVRSKQEIPHFYVSAEIDMSQAMELRRQVNSGLENDSRVSVNDLIVKASVEALQKHPKFNASYSDDGIQMHDTVNVGIAIAQEAGLLVPALIDCAGKSLIEMAAASKDLVQRANSGTLHPREYTGGTFAISNMGMFGVSSFVAIIQPPQSAMLAVGGVAKQAVVRDDQLAVADMMTATLSADHRVVDGSEGARFIGEIKRILEHPFILLM
jgi:pyruvate dehydrogenase E2 component (dihydrolipoamide acetyltransferase)